jgi:hypothetical protein
MMRIRIAMPLAAILLVSVLASTAHASSPIYISSPIPNKSWSAGGEHQDFYQGNQLARDITGTDWTTNDPITFSPSSPGANISAFVQSARINCSIGGPDYYVQLEIWGSGEYYGLVDYAHMRSLNVTEGTTISPGQILGYPQTAASWRPSDGALCWTGLHSHVGRSSSGQWNATGGPYSTYMLTFPVGIPMSPQQAESLVNTTKRGPVVK